MQLEQNVRCESISSHLEHTLHQSTCALIKDEFTRRDHVQYLIRQEAPKIILYHLNQQRNHDVVTGDTIRCSNGLLSILVQVTSVSRDICEALLDSGFLEYFKSRSVHHRVSSYDEIKPLFF